MDAPTDPADAVDLAPIAQVTSWTVYIAATGKILGSTTAKLPPVLADDQAMLPGVSNPRTQRVNISDPKKHFVEPIPAEIMAAVEAKNNQPPPPDRLDQVVAVLAYLRQHGLDLGPDGDALLGPLKRP